LGEVIAFDILPADRVGYYDLEYNSSDWSGTTILNGYAVQTTPNLLSPHLPFPVGSGNEPNFWGSNGTADSNWEDENIRRYDYFPHGNHDVVWIARNRDGDPNGATSPMSHDGGFDSQQFAIDHTKRYRFSIWVKQTALHANPEGQVYFGLHGYNSVTGSSNAIHQVNGAVILEANAADPYFKAGGPLGAYGKNIENEWILLVGYVDASGEGRTYGHGISSMLDMDNRNVSYDDTDDRHNRYFRWEAGATHTNIRAYHNWNTSGGADDVIFWGPRVEEVGVSGLLNQPTYVSTEDLITKGGYSDTTGGWGITTGIQTWEVGSLPNVQNMAFTGLDCKLQYTHTHVCKHGETWSGRDEDVHDYIPAGVATPRLLQHSISGRITMDALRWSQNPQDDFEAAPDTLGYYQQQKYYIVPGLYLRFIPRKGAKYLITIMITHSHSYVISFGCNLTIPPFEGGNGVSPLYFGYPLDKHGIPVKTSGTNNNTDHAITTSYEGGNNPDHISSTTYSFVLDPERNIGQLSCDDCLPGYAYPPYVWGRRLTLTPTVMARWAGTESLLYINNRSGNDMASTSTITAQEYFE